MKQTLTITEDEFYREYKPILNPLNQNASFDGYLFETYNCDLSYVKKISNNTVWTIVDSDDRLYLINGYHIVNRIGYFVCENPYPDGQIIEVEL